MSERLKRPASERGVTIAASRLGITIEEYRQHEAAGEAWCPRCESWQPGSPNAYCRPCWNEYMRERHSNSGGITTIYGAGA